MHADGRGRASSIRVYPRLSAVLPGCSRLWGHMLFPGARGKPPWSALTREHFLVQWPLVPGQLVGHFNAIAVGITEINANGDAVVRHMVNSNVLLFEALIHLLQIVQAMHHPGHVIEAHLPLLLQGSVVTHLDQRHLV